MEALQTVLLIAHLVGMAAIVGGGLEQWPARKRHISAVMVWGARAQLVTGLILVGLMQAIEPDEANNAKFAVKLLVALAVAGLAEVGFRRAKAERMWAGVLLLTLINVTVAVAWH
ncbi:MAG TPA: hypothetical protein VFD20_02340 [Demequina sp.]|nr:hypothetical protein [Demequina sp.]